MEKSFTFHTDAGHGWLEVLQADYEAAGLSARDFTRYSYQKKGAHGLTFYLEEDQDAPLFLHKYKTTTGHSPLLPEIHAPYGDHPIRNYERVGE